LLELSSKLIKVFVDDVELGIYFCSLQLIDRMTKMISCSIRLDSELYFTNNLLVYGYLERHITDRNFVTKTILDFGDSESRLLFVFLSVFLDKGLNCLNGCYDVRDREEDTLGCKHVSNFELYILFLSQ
jgi:hypothetical protein